MSRSTTRERLESSPYLAPLHWTDGSAFAIVLCMNNKRAIRHRDATTAFIRVIRGFAEASLVALAFAVAIVLIGMPVTLIVRGLHEGLSWLVRLGGEMSGVIDAVVSVSSVAGGLVIAAVFARLLVRIFHWRRTFRARVISREIRHTPAGRRAIGSAA